MRFKNYCIVALGEINGIMNIISRVSETKVRKLEQKGVLICTFSSVLEPNELKELIGSEDKTFFIFEIGTDSTSYQIGRKDIHNQLFGYIESGGEEVIKFMTNKLISDINETIDKMTDVTNNGTQFEKEDDNIIDVTKLTKIQKQKKIDILLDKGLNNLNTKEKKLLDLLTKNI